MSAPHYLCLDCETTGLFLFKDKTGNSVPADAPGQPRLAHVDFIWLNSELEQERQEDFYIKPDGWTVDPGAAAVNGLTMEKLERDGVPIAQVLDIWEAAIKEGRIAVAFNAQFDTKCLRAELRRAGRDDLFEQTPNICTMRELVGVCKIPRTQPGGGYKFPKLAEACAYFKIVQGEQHTATDDNRCNAELLRKLKWLNLMPEPRVFYAKNRPIPAIELNQAESDLLTWLSQEQFSQYGECHSAALDSLIAKHFVQVHQGCEHQGRFVAKGDSKMYCAVSLTDAGRARLPLCEALEKSIDYDAAIKNAAKDGARAYRIESWRHPNDPNPVADEDF